MHCLPIALLGTLWLVASPPAQTVPEQSPVPRLRELLRSADPAVRRAAAQGLAHRGHYDIGLPTEAAVPDLLSVFASDPDPAVAAMTALALAANAPSPLGAIDHIVARLDAWSRGGADADAVERLRVLLQHPERQWLGQAVAPHLLRIATSPGHAAEALGALAMLGADAESTAPGLLALLPTLDAKDRWRAAFTLACTGGSTAMVMAPHTVADDAQLRLWAVRARCRNEPPSAELAALVSPWLADERLPVRRWAVETAVRFGASFAGEVDKVAAMVPESTTRHDAFAILHALGPHAAPAVPTLLERLPATLEPDWEGATAALAAIGPGAAAATEALLAFAQAAIPKDTMEAQRVENRAGLAVMALATIAPERAVLALWPGVAAAPDDAFPATWHRVHRFACLGPAAASALPQLRDLMRSGDRLAAARALLVLQRLGAAAAPAALDLVPWLRSDDDYVRGRALAVVWSIGPAAASLLPEVTALFERTTGNHRTDAMREAGRLGPTAVPLLLRALRVDDAWTPRIAAEQLVQAAVHFPEARAAVFAHLEDADGQLAHHLLTSGRFAATPDLQDVMLEQARRVLATTTDPGLRRACIDLLARSLLRPQPADPSHGWWTYGDLSGLLADWGVDQRRAEELAVFHDAKGLAGWARSFLPAKAAGRGAELAALLGRLPSSEANLHALSGLASHADALVRRAAVQAIGWHGEAAGGCAATLAAAMRDPDWFVRAAALTSLRAVQEPRRTK